MTKRSESTTQTRCYHESRFLRRRQCSVARRSVDLYFGRSPPGETGKLVVLDYPDEPSGARFEADDREGVVVDGAEDSREGSSCCLPTAKALRPYRPTNGVLSQGQRCLPGLRGKGRAQWLALSRPYKDRGIPRSAFARNATHAGEHNRTNRCFAWVCRSCADGHRLYGAGSQCRLSGRRQSHDQACWAWPQGCGLCREPSQRSSSQRLDGRFEGCESAQHAATAFWRKTSPSRSAGRYSKSFSRSSRNKCFLL